MKALFLVLLSSVGLVSVLAPSATAQTPQEIARKAYAATVLLVLEDENGQPTSMGSGFFVQDSIVATSLHVLQGAKSGYAKLVNQRSRYDILGIVASDVDRDIALVKVSASGVPPLKLASINTLEVADTVYAVGNPYGLEGTFSEGIISGIRAAGKHKLLQITAPISPGSSGGPVLNTHGQVVGLSVATFVEGQNLNFAIPSDYLSELQRTQGNIRPIDSVNPDRGNPSILATYMPRPQEYVTPTAFAWNANQYMGYYTFSVRNSLRQAVKNVLCIVIFYGNDGLPIETEMVSIPGPVGAGLAKRSPELGRIDASEVRNLTNKTEIRVLTYELAD